jgi:rRNA maturation endonuclease Nob1
MAVEGAMNHKRFLYLCPACERTGLQPDLKAVYKVRRCDACGGEGKMRITVMRRIELDQEVAGGA